MTPISRVLYLLPALLLAGCATTPMTSNITSDPLMNPPAVNNTPGAPSAPAQNVAVAAQATDVSGYVDPAALALMGPKSKADATAAQFYALQFGRVGAQRAWSGDSGQSGTVSVGPFVRVNLIDCRDFTHIVMIAGASYVWKGTACRETDGSWTVTPDRKG